MNEETQQEVAEQPGFEVAGIEERFHPAVRAHGRALFVLVLNSNIAQEALKEIARMAEKHQSKSLAVAGVALGNTLRDMGASYAGAKGWTQEEIDACARDIMLAATEKRIQLLN